MHCSAQEKEGGLLVYDRLVISIPGAVANQVPVAKKKLMNRQLNELLQGAEGMTLDSASNFNKFFGRHLVKTLS